MTKFSVVLYYSINGDFMQRFKPKRRLKKNMFLKLFLFLIFSFLIFKLISLLIVKFPRNNFLKLLLIDNNLSFENGSKENLVSKLYSYARENIINKPNSLIVSNVAFKKNNKIEVIKKQDRKENNEIKEKTIEPLVYIYSSHQKEGYSIEYTEDYNIDPNVFLASSILQEKLNNINIKTELMKDDITKYLSDNGLDYSYSYVGSRYYLKPVIERYKSMKLIIDLHRDAAKKDVTTTVINDKSCAKVMFVVGLDHDNYQSNLDFSMNLNDKIVAKYPSLSRGVIKRTGEGVNGIYNQDLAPNIILLELGGNHNNLDEVINTIDLIVPIIGEYINEK